MMNTLKNNRENKGQHIRRTALSVLMVLVLCVGLVAIPFESHAASKKKTVLSVSNLSSDTVVQRGGAYRINARAYRKNGSAIKGLKVKYKSSNKKIATVSKNGVIRGKKNGKVKITVRCKGKKKTYKIRVGTQVNSLSISGYHYLRKGRTNTLKAHVNGNATNKTVHWRSTNTSVATITNSGNLKATGYGTATIVAYAVDGSGTAAQVHKLCGASGKKEVQDEGEDQDKAERFDALDQQPDRQAASGVVNVTSGRRNMKHLRYQGLKQKTMSAFQKCKYQKTRKIPER